MNGRVAGRKGAMSTTVKVLLVAMLLIVMAVIVIAPARQALTSLGSKAVKSIAESFLNIGNLISGY